MCVCVKAGFLSEEAVHLHVAVKRADLRQAVSLPLVWRAVSRLATALSCQDKEGSHSVRTATSAILGGHAERCML